MIRRRLNVTRLIPVALGLMLSAAIGCNTSASNSGSTQPTTPAPPGGRMGSATENIVAKLPGGEQFAAGKKVYSDNNCVRCHKLGETGAGMMAAPPSGGPPPAGGPGGGAPRGGGFGRGPELTKVGANPEHTKQWIAEHIRNPRAHKPQSRMPGFGPEKISDADLDALAEYLASLK